MKIYLAAQFKEQAFMREWRRLLHDAGHLVTSRWIDEVPDTLSDDEASEVCLADIDICTIFISHTLSRGDLYTGGGRHVEYGYALKSGKILINIGGKENVFHSRAIYFPTIEKAIKWINEYD